MSKHTGPWRADRWGFVRDVTGESIGRFITNDPETRAVLLHAAEMWKRIKAMAQPDGTYDVRWATAVDMEREIEAEIAAGRKT